MVAKIANTHMRNVALYEERLFIYKKKHYNQFALTKHT
jgi:hypothetical protein